MFETRDGVVGLRKPLSGLPQPQADRRGPCRCSMVMIGTVSFDGFTNKRTWNSRSPDIAQFFQDHLSLSPEHSLELAFLLGMLAMVLFVSGFYWLGILGARSVGGGFSAQAAGRRSSCTRWCRSRWRTWAPTTSRCCSSRARRWPTSPPTRSGDGSNIFGTAGSTDALRPDRRRTCEWYWKVAMIVSGHVAALILAHDRAWPSTATRAQAVRSQYWMLGVMLGFTMLAIWLVSESNT